MGLLSWLGLKKGDNYPNLDALMRDLREALPDDESVLLRYIGTVVVLLGKVAWADGRVTAKEEEQLRALLTHIEGIAPSRVDAVYEALYRKVPDFSEREMELVYRELRALCDGNERRQIMRLLLGLAGADGRLSGEEQRELEKISEELGVPLDEVEPPQETGGEAGPEAGAPPSGPPPTSGGA